MPSLNIRKVGDGPRCYAVWLDHWPVFLDGLDGLPHIGDRFEIDGELWRVVEVYDRIICEREPSCTGCRSPNPKSPPDRIAPPAFHLIIVHNYLKLD